MKKDDLIKALTIADVTIEKIDRLFILDCGSYFDLTVQCDGFEKNWNKTFKDEENGITYPTPDAVVYSQRIIIKKDGFYDRRR